MQPSAFTNWLSNPGHHKCRGPHVPKWLVARSSRRYVVCASQQQSPATVHPFMCSGRSRTTHGICCPAFVPRTLQKSCSLPQLHVLLQKDLLVISWATNISYFLSIFLLAGHQYIGSQWNTFEHGASEMGRTNES